MRNRALLASLALVGSLFMMAGSAQAHDNWGGRPVANAYSPFGPYAQPVMGHQYTPPHPVSTPVWQQQHYGSYQQHGRGHHYGHGNHHHRHHHRDNWSRHNSHNYRW